MNPIPTVFLWLFCFGCSVNSENTTSTADDRATLSPTIPEKAVPHPPAPIDTSRISRLTLSESLNRFGKPIEQLACDFPNESAAGLREGLTQYISIDSKQQVRIKQLTWKQGKHRTTVFYRYQKGDWRPLYLHSWREGMVF